MTLDGRTYVVPGEFPAFSQSVGSLRFTEQASQTLINCLLDKPLQIIQWYWYVNHWTVLWL